MRKMRKMLVILVALMAFSLMAGVALAADPSGDGSNMTYTESGNTPEGSEYNANTPVTEEGNLAGASRWTYKDNYDAAKKYEGSYNAFQDQDNQLYDYDDSGRDSGPHGGYDTSSNKCKTCHAVHRATGTFALMRVDTPDQACEYCHIGDHRHSVVNAFWQAGTIYPANGHTMGAGDSIPDSSVWQWEETTTVTAGDDEEFTIRARRYSATKNKLMRWTMHGGKWIRVGPTLLRCQSCHQPHNATQQVWKPGKSIDNGATTWTEGYKLLRLSPSGGVKSGLTGADAGGAAVSSTDYRQNPDLGYIEFASGTDPRLKVLEGPTVDVRAVAGAGGVDLTGYTPYRYHADGKDANDAGFASIPVFETSMSFFCADCHNLNIAGKDQVDSNLGVGKYGNSMLGDRSHAIPFMIRVDGTGPGAQAQSGFHCYTCHNNDMPYTIQDLTTTDVGTLNMAGKRDCGECHISPKMYREYKQTYRTFQGVAGGPSYSDWPHSGKPAGYKLLNGIAASGDFDSGSNAPGPGEVSGNAVRQPYVAGADGLDKICLICHGPVKSRSIGYDK